MWVIIIISITTVIATVRHFTASTASIKMVWYAFGEHDALRFSYTVKKNCYKGIFGILPLLCFGFFESFPLLIPITAAGEEENQWLPSNT